MRYKVFFTFLFATFLVFPIFNAEAAGSQDVRRGDPMPNISWTVSGTNAPCSFATVYPGGQSSDGIKALWETPKNTPPSGTGVVNFSPRRVWAAPGSYVFTCSIGQYTDSATLNVLDCASGTTWNSTSNTCVANAPGAPATPGNFNGTPGSCGTNQINFTWSASAGATSYEGQVNGGTWTSLGNVTSYLYTAPQPNTTYAFSVRAVNSGGVASAPAGPLNRTSPAACPPVGTAPATPGNFNGTPGSCSTNQINFTWSASAGATSYEGELDSNGTWTPLGNVTSYTFNAPSPNTSYTFRLRAVNAFGVSVPSAGPIARTSPAACPVTYTIVSSAGSGGTIAPLGTVSGIPAGASVGFTVSPSAGYVNTNIIVNGFPIGSGTGYTFSNVNSNQTISASFALASATGSITANNCVIPVGGSSCSSTVSWTTTSVASPVISGTNGWVVPGASGNNVSVTVPYGTTTFTLSDSNGQIAQRSVLAQCGGTASWNGSTCVASVASLSVNPPSCAIPIGQATCTVNFTWSAPGFVSPNLYNFTRNVMYSNAGSGTNEPFAITYGANTIYLRDGVSVQVVVGATGTCSGTWNGSLCVAGTPSATLSVGSCTIPVNTGSCNAPVSWTSANLTTTPSIEQNTIQFSTTSVVAPAAGLTRPMTFGSGLANTIRFMHSATALDTKSGTGTCALGTFWDSLKCAPVCAPNNDCASAASVTQAATVCIGGTFSIADGCGNTIVCNGARSCDYNWKEVAP